MPTRPMTLTIAMLGLLVLSGCCLFRTGPKGPPLDPKVILQRMEANNARVLALRGKVGVSFRTPGQLIFIPLDGALVFQKPDLIRLELSKYGRRMIDLGADEEEYWFWSREALMEWPENTLGVGRVARIDEAAGRGLILRPDVVADALGAGYLRPADPLEAALPEVYDDELVLDYVRRVGPRLRLVKKTYLDRYTGRLSRTDYFAPDGARVLLLTFDSVRTVDGVELIRHVTFNLPDQNVTLRFDLSGLTLNPDVSRDPFDPFARPEFPGAIVKDLDAQP
jgi:outer membrane lipoprotein-sorting protein